jgi:hypothetical protein
MGFGMQFSDGKTGWTASFSRRKTLQVKLRLDLHPFDPPWRRHAAISAWSKHGMAKLRRDESIIRNEGSPFENIS